MNDDPFGKCQAIPCVYFGPLQAYNGELLCPECLRAIQAQEIEEGDAFHDWPEHTGEEFEWPAR